MIVSVTELLKVVSSHMAEHLDVSGLTGEVLGKQKVLDEIKKYFEETNNSKQFTVINADLVSLRAAYKERFLDSTQTQGQLDGAESVWEWIAEQFSGLKSENDQLTSQSHHDDNTISIFSGLIKEQQNKLRLFVEAVQKLEEWNKKYPPGKVYDYGQAGTIENLLQECLKMLIASKELVAHGDHAKFIIGNLKK